MQGSCKIFVPAVVSNLNWSFHNYHLSGSTYEKDDTKQARPRYNYWDDFKKKMKQYKTIVGWDDFKKKMKQYKTIVGEDVATQFYQNITGEVKD